MVDPALELLDVLSEDGSSVIGSAPRSEVHARGLPHRAVHVLVFSSTGGELLLQLRSRGKASHPGLWDTSVGGHVDAGESMEAAALRETFEELGLRVDPESLQALPSHRVDLPGDVEWVGSYALVHDGPFHPDPTEVETVRWLPFDGVERLVAEGATTPHFAIQWRLWLRERMRDGSRAA